MTITIPEALENDLTERANRLSLSIEQLVEQGLNWYLSIDTELWEEIADWEATGVEDMLKFEESLG